MKQVILLCSIFLFFACQMNKEEAPTQDSKQETTADVNGFDAELAKKLGADDYGMAQYVMAFLKKGPNRSQDSLARAELQKGHMANISRLAEEGKLVMAGPFLDDGEIRGIYIFDVKTIEEAKVLTETDPAIQAGSLIMELHPWYGSAALKQMGELHEKIAKIDI
jgi:uncharacterized protein YciI